MNALRENIRAISAGLAAFVFLISRAVAGEVSVTQASAFREAGNRFTFEVTLEHEDEGWEHYAVGWEILGPDGQTLGRRILVHPHVDEQPFTRRLSGVFVPPGVTSVRVRGYDNVHGLGRSSLVVQLPE